MGDPLKGSGDWLRGVVTLLTSRAGKLRATRILNVAVPLLALIAGVAPSSMSPARSAGRPSVVLITVDTLRADHLGSYGFALDASPQIDRFAAQGVLFERAIAGASATAPSHASILSSRFTREHSIGFRNGDTRLGGVPTLATVFRDAGYATAAFVSNVVLRRGRGFETGFDVYDDDVPVAELNRSEIHERLAPQTTAAALAWLESRRDRPFFLWVHYQDPHGPYAPPPDFRGRFHLPRRTDQRPLAVLADNSGQGGIPAYQVLGDLRHPTVYEGRYADEIFYADVSIGKLIEAADRAAGARGAVVLLTADHGESFGEEDRFFVHGAATTPDLAHVPMILRAPGLAPGRRADLVHHVDVLPTLLELAGISASAPTSGIALGPMLRAGTPLPERTVFTDIGMELSAYTRSGFLRVYGAQAAWQRRADAHAALAPVAKPYAWNGGGTWRAEGPRAGLPAEVARYIRTAVPMESAGGVSEQDLERLRALGYLEVAASDRDTRAVGW